MVSIKRKIDKLKGYVGHIKIDEQGRIVESKNIANPAKLAEIVNVNLKKGNEEARELGFKRMNGFAMFGEKESLAFMKGLGVVVDSEKVDWQDLFVYYTFNVAFCATGVILTVFSLILFYIAIFTKFMYFLAPEPRFYIPTILIIIGVFFLAISKSKLAYRLE